MNHVILKVVLALAMSFVTNASFAEGDADSGNHGRGFKVTKPGPDQGKIFFADLVNRPTTRTLELVEDGWLDKLSDHLERKAGFDTSTSMKIESEQSTVSNRTKILRTLYTLDFKIVEGELPSIDDMGNVELYKWEHKDGYYIDVAYQNILERQVLVSSKAWDDMTDEKDRLALFLHEALIRIWYDSNYDKKLETTEHIASIVNPTMKNRLEEMGPRKVSRLLCNAGIPSIPKVYYNWSNSGYLVHDTVEFHSRRVLFFAQKDDQCHFAEGTLLPEYPARGDSSVTGDTYFYDWRFSVDHEYLGKANLYFGIMKSSYRSSEKFRVISIGSYVKGIFPHMQFDDSLERIQAKFLILIPPPEIPCEGCLKSTPGTPSTP